MNRGGDGEISEEISLIPMMDMSGLAGFQDEVNKMFIVKVKESVFATAEQNMELEKALEEVYKNYLKDVKRSNNGRY